MSRQVMHAAEIGMVDSGGASHFPGGLPADPRQQPAILFGERDSLPVSQTVRIGRRPPA